MSDRIEHPIEHSLSANATEDQQRDFFVGVYEACKMLLTSPRIKPAQREVIEEMAYAAQERLEGLGVRFNES